MKHFSAYGWYLTAMLTGVGINIAFASSLRNELATAQHLQLKIEALQQDFTAFTQQSVNAQQAQANFWLQQKQQVQETLNDLLAMATPAQRETVYQARHFSALTKRVTAIEQQVVKP